VPLKDGDELRFGAIRLTLRFPSRPRKRSPRIRRETVRGDPAKPVAALPSFSGKTSPVPAPQAEEMGRARS
jgi:hypothetical protein